MSTEQSVPSAAVLRSLCVSLSLDLAHAPLKSRNYKRLTQLTKNYLNLEKTMAATSDQVGRAISNATQLIEEARKWESLAEERGALAVVMDQSICRVSGVQAGSDVCQVVGASAGGEHVDKTNDNTTPEL